jgi:hypothetical protein
MTTVGLEGEGETVERVLDTKGPSIGGRRRSI